MEKAILKTLIYADIFDYPLKAHEIHKWLIGRQASLRQVEKALAVLSQKSKVKSQNGYYFSPRRKNLVAKRKRKEKQSERYFQKSKIFGQILKIIPWIKLVGISGGLALNNADKKDDIDLFIITGSSRLWLSRIFIIFLLDIFGVRRKVSTKPSKVFGKLCINTILEQDFLEQEFKDIFVAHEILQMKVLWEKEGVYGKYLADNEWAFKYLPNWTTSARGPATLSLRAREARRGNLFKKDSHVASLLGMTVERLAKWLQLKIMQKPQGMERIEDGALYFYPKDCREKILNLYTGKLKNLATLDNKC